MEQLERIVSLLLIPILPSLAILLGLYLQKAIQKAKAELALTEGSQIALRLDEAGQAVAAAVLYTAQTYTEYMKSKNAFDRDAQKEALLLATSKAKMLMSTAAQETIQKVSGDVDVWIKTMIEAKINEMKPVELKALPIVDCPDDGVK